MYSPKINTVSVLNGLALINAERITGYNKVLQLLPDDTTAYHKYARLRSPLADIVRETMKFCRTLENIVLIEGGKNDQNIKVNQELLELAKDIGTAFTGLSKDGFLPACELCEHLSQKAYSLALDQSLQPELYQIVGAQKLELQKSQASIRSLQNRLTPAVNDNNKDVNDDLHKLTNPGKPILLAAG
ncbi:MAG: hypothetical protein H7Y86_01935 [Rhizobacter sp.]|nr:hypothetical protein [Ferruginibacter sp.]